MKWASIQTAAAPWCGWTHAISARPKSKPCWAMPPRRRQKLGWTAEVTFEESGRGNGRRRISTVAKRDALVAKEGLQGLQPSRVARVTLTQESRIYVAGHRGLVGSAVVRALQRRGYRNLIVRTHQELDLTEQSAVREFFDETRPEAVIMAAARVGGIHANNSHPAGFLRDNLLIQDNVIDAA